MRNHSQLREHSYIGESVDGTWRLDLEEPIPLNLPVSEQVELLYRYGYFGEANQALANQYGFDDSTEIIGFRLNQFIPRDLPSSISLLIRIAESNYSLQGWESTEQDRYGNRKYFLNNCSGEIENAKLLRVWGTAKDITQQKELENVARLHSEMFEQVPDGCVIIEAVSEKIVYSNSAFSRITGYTKSDVPEKKLSFLQGDGTDQQTVSKIREAIAHE